jgi:putative membrane protein
MKKKIEIISTVILFTMICASCNNNNNQRTDSGATNTEQNNGISDDDKEKDAKFLEAAAEMNLEEIKLGQLAQNNSTMVEIQRFGKMMEDEHTSSLKALQALAAKKDVVIPTSLSKDSEKTYKKLSDKTGEDFDKEYCDIIVKEHKDAIDEFSEQSTHAADGDIRSWAASMLPALRMHLDQANTCQKAYEENQKNNRSKK